MAGDLLGDALGIVEDLGKEGIRATLDVLGEEVVTVGAVRRGLDAYLDLVDALTGVPRDATVSVKPTMLGLRLGEELAEEHLDILHAAAARAGLLVQIDMEDHTTTAATLRLHRRMMDRHGNSGAVLQARLRRTAQDVRSFGETDTVRLCKGIYPENPRIAWTGEQEIRDAWIDALAALLDAGAFVGLATHDDALVRAAEDEIARRGLGTDRYEFQMLLGVRPALRDSLARRGHPVRVYVPYGEDWEAYSVRRLRENPQVALHVIRALAGLYRRVD